MGCVGVRAAWVVSRLRAGWSTGWAVGSRCTASCAADSVWLMAQGGPRPWGGGGGRGYGRGWVGVRVVRRGRGGGRWWVRLGGGGWWRSGRAGAEAADG